MFTTRLVLVPVTLALTACASAPEPAPTRSCTVALVRHAEAYTNVGPTDGLTEEQANVLTENGKTQARALGEELKKLGFERLYSSDVGRAVNTSTLIQEVAGLEGFVIDPKFTILHRGTDTNPEVGSWNWRVNFWKSGEDATPPGGESLADGTQRATEALSSYCAIHTRFAVVTHSDIIAGVRASQARVPLTQAHESMIIKPATFTLINLTIPAP